MGSLPGWNAMRKSKEEQDNRARAAGEEPEGRREPAADDECCALLRAHPSATPGSAPRPRRAHEDNRDDRA